MADKKAKPKSKLLILIILILVLLLAAGGGVWFFFFKSPTNAEESVKVEAPVQPTFLAMQPLTVSLVEKKDNRSYNRVLYVGITFSLSDDKSSALVNSYLPEIRSKLLLFLSKQDVATLYTDEGKQAVRNDILALLRKDYQTERLQLNISDVLFSDFIIR